MELCFQPRPPKQEFQADQNLDLQKNQKNQNQPVQSNCALCLAISCLKDLAAELLLQTEVYRFRLHHRPCC